MSTLKSTLAQRRKHDEGFTLIELMVVVMIIAVLMAIAIPTFLGSQNKAKDRSAQSSLRNTVTAAKTVYADSTSYATVTNVTLQAAEPSLTFQALPATVSNGPKNVALATSTATAFFAAALSDSGTCYYITDSVSAGTLYSKSSTGTECTGTKAAAPTVAYSANGWS